MRTLLAVLLSGYAFAGVAGLACAAAAEPEPARGAPQAYAGVGVGLVDYSGGSSKASPKLFGGYEFTNKLALEAGALDFKKGYGLYIAVKPTLPLTEKLSAYGKVGVAKSRREIILPSAPALKKSDTGAYGAFGLQYSITPNAAVTLEYERLPMQKPDVLKPNVWTLALQFFF